MNFLEAVKAMKEGIKVSAKGKDAIYHIDGCYIKDQDDNDFVVSNHHVILSDWEIVEEKKTLSDKLENVHLSTGELVITEANVKEALKEFLDEVKSKTFQMGDSEEAPAWHRIHVLLMEIAKYKFGDKLV